MTKPYQLNKLNSKQKALLKLICHAKSQAALGEIVSRGQKTVSCWFTGRSRIPFEKAKELVSYAKKERIKGVDIQALTPEIDW